MSAPVGHDVGYKLTGHGAALVGDFGADLAALRARPRGLLAPHRSGDILIAPCR
jgi:hypothetical protein